MRNYIFKSIAFVIVWTLIFSFIAGTLYVTKWGITIRVIYVITLILALIITDKE